MATICNWTGRGVRHRRRMVSGGSQVHAGSIHPGLDHQTIRGTKQQTARKHTPSIFHPNARETNLTRLARTRARPVRLELLDVV